MRGERSSAGEVGARALAAAFVLVIAIAVPRASFGARLVDVRVGVHPGFARVVLETDAPAAHDVLSADAAEVVVRIEAASAARTLPARADGAPAIVLEPTADGATLARIRASGPLRVESQVLAAPPRVVLDLRKAAETEAAEPEPAESAPVEVSAAPEPVAVAAAPTPEPVVPPPPAEPSAAPTDPDPSPSEAALPPVAAPPPAAIALEPRSLATGLAIGFALALFAFAARRPARAIPAEAPPPPEPPPSEAEAPAVAAEPERTSLAGEFMHDLVGMHQRLDTRLAEVATRLDGVTARLDRLAANGSAQGEEIASQRIAIARLRAALRPAPRVPRREETATPAGPR